MMPIEYQIHPVVVQEFLTVWDLSLQCLVMRNLLLGSKNNYLHFVKVYIVSFDYTRTA